MIDRIKRHLAQGEYVQAAALGRAMYMQDVAPGERAEAALLAAEASHMLRSWFEAIDLSRRALSLADEIQRMDLKGSAYFRLCGALVGVGDHAEGVDAGRAFLDGLDMWPELDCKAGPCLANLGMAYKGLSRVPEALQAFWRAQKRFEASGDLHGQVKVRQIMAWMLATQGECDEAEEHLTACQELLAAGAPEYLQTHQLTHLAYLRVQQGRHPDALMLAREVLAPGRPNVQPASLAVAYYVLGTCAMVTNQVDIAETMWVLGQGEAVKGGVGEIMNLLSALRRQIHAAKQPPQE